MSLEDLIDVASCLIEVIDKSDDLREDEKQLAYEISQELRYPIDSGNESADSEQPDDERSEEENK